MPPMAAAWTAGAVGGLTGFARAACTRRTGDGAAPAPVLDCSAARVARAALVAAVRRHRWPAMLRSTPAPAPRRRLLRPSRSARSAPKPQARRRGRQGDKQMLVQATEVQYDYSNERVSAVGNVQIYYGGSTLEADKVIYDQKTKRLHAEGNVRLTEADGNDHLRRDHGSERRLSRRLRRFAAARRAGADPLRRRARRPLERQLSPSSRAASTPPASRARTIPKKPPLWQVKAARIIHDEGEKMMYFEDAQLEFFGVPIAYLPYFSAPDPTVKRKTGCADADLLARARSTASGSRSRTTGRWRRTTTSPSRR